MSVTPLACRSCASTRLLAVPARDLVFCPACSLLQGSAAVADVEEVSPLRSQSELLTAHARELAAQVIQARGLGPDSLVIEAGSNDGWLLRHYRDAGVPVLGLEVDRAAAKAARQRHGIPTREGAFSRGLADRLVLQGLQADVLHAHNVLHKSADLAGFVRGVRRVLKPDGVAVIETPYICDQLDALRPDTLCCFSLTALRYCFAAPGLVILDAERVPVEGGSLRVWAGTPFSGMRRQERVEALAAEEEAWGVRSVETYAGDKRNAA
jgi:SAM-dependent methyltransferase